MQCSFRFGRYALSFAALSLAALLSFVALSLLAFAALICVQIPNKDGCRGSWTNRLVSTLTERSKNVPTITESHSQ